MKPNFAKKTFKKKPLESKATAKKTRVINESSTVYLSNLSYERDKAGIKILMSRYGEVKTINLVIDLDTKVSKGMAFVEMGSIAEAKLAIAGLNQQQIDGRTLKASYAIPQKPMILKLKSEIDAEKEAAMAKRKPAFKAKTTTPGSKPRPTAKPFPRAPGKAPASKGAAKPAFAKKKKTTESGFVPRKKSLR